MNDLISMTACDLVEALDQSDVSPVEALDAVEQRMDEVDGRVNALPTRCFERAREHAKRIMSLPMGERGLLRGLPVPIKDLTNVSGVRTSFGSLITGNLIADTSDILVENLETNGGIVYAKSNTPEFGAGGNTFNDVFGPTRNPHDLSRSAGGSSGGAAAALASGTAWLAHGSDLAGSLRTPASFCGVTSLRPSPGLIVNGPSNLPFYSQPQEGPMARNVSDLALFTDALVGASSLTGLSKAVPSTSFQTMAARPEKPSRVAFSADLGVTTTSTEVLKVVNAAMAKLERSGILVEQSQPDLEGVDEAFDVPRALAYASGIGLKLDENRHLIKPEVVWNAEMGLSLDGAAIRSAMAAEGRVFNSAAGFMQNYDLLICPATIVPAILVEERYLGCDDGVEIPDYYRWLAIAYAITVTRLPVITIPCGVTESGLPVGIQLIGKAHGDQRLFSLARHIEGILEWGGQPVTPVG